MRHLETIMFFLVLSIPLRPMAQDAPVTVEAEAPAPEAQGTEAEEAQGTEAEEAQGTEAEEVISVFSQKGGMLLEGEHSVYLRSNDEWTGFSSFFVGYRHGTTDDFQVAFEVGASAIPHAYFAALLTYWRIYESPDRRFFIGARTQTGYRYQDSDFSSEGWHGIVGENYLTLQRNGIYLVLDLTFAVRFGQDRRHKLYYSVYPRVDIDFVDAVDRVYVMFSPVMLGYEFRWRRYPNWSFAIEAGYTFPLPWNSIPAGRWPNFPSLANIGFYYRW
jgi:hypothetical protein